jgi:hypothetical protein
MVRHEKGNAMFDALTDKLGKVFDGLTGRGALSEKDVNEALREIRVALLGSRRRAAGGQEIHR